MSNIVLNSGSGGSTIATDTVTAVEHQLVKLEFGVAGSATLVSTSNGLPTAPVDNATRDNGKIDIASLDQLPTADYDTGGGVQTVPMIGIGLPASGGTVPGGTATNPIQVSLANTAANSIAVKVDGSAVTQPVSGTFWQTTQPVSGTFWQTTQPVSIAATVPTSETGRGTVFHGQAAIPTTAGGTALASNACKTVTVKNLQSNASIIWVGVTGVTAGTGYELNPGESITLQVSNSNLIYGLSASGTQNLCFIGTN